MSAEQSTKVCDELGDLLSDIGWVCRNDAQWSRLQEALPRIKEVVSRLQAQESREAEPVAKIVFDTRSKDGVLVSKSRPQVFKVVSDEVLMQYEPDTPLYTSKQALSAEADKIELSAEVEARIDDRAEAAYWAFDAAHKGLGEWKDRPQSERDAFKSQFRKYMRAERQSAKLMLRIQKSEQAP